MAADGEVNKCADARTPSATGARRCGAAVLLSLAPQAALAGPAPTAAAPLDLTTLPFEQRLSLDVYSASKFVQRAEQAPASVTVIGASDIKAFGWRTLADALRSVRGLYLSYDRNDTCLWPRATLLVRGGGFWLANLNPYSRRLTRHADAAAGIYNLCDRRDAESAPPGQRQDSQAQNRRAVRAPLNHAF